MLDDSFCLIGAVDFTFEYPLASGLRGEVVVSEKITLIAWTQYQLVHLALFILATYCSTTQ